MNSETRYVIGVDGGGTGCRAALVDADGSVRATAEAGPANATTDFAAAVQNVHAAIAAVCAQLDAAPETLGAHIGLAGIMSAADGARFRDALGLPLAAVSDDRPTMLAGALGGEDGALAAIGTGSFVAASNRGVFRTVGGWGLHLGDQASGAWMGKALLQHVMLVHDGLAEPSPLTEAVLERFGSAEGLVSFAAEAQPQDYAELAPRIVHAAETSDAVGMDLMQRGGDYLSQALLSLQPGADAPICLTGGLGPHYARWIAPGLADRITPAKGSALDGALILARGHK